MGQNLAMRWSMGQRAISIISHSVVDTVPSSMIGSISLRI